MRRLLSMLVVGLVASPAAAAAPILDGTADASYGAAAAVQTVQTGFGDNFSELDAGYGQVSGGKLYLMLTGNIEANQNRLEVFVDSKAGGQNVLLNNASTPTNDSWAPAYAGFTFDSGFTADYMFILRRSGTSFNVDLATIGGGPSAFEAATNIFGGSSTGANANALPLAGVGVAYDNSNSAGVTGGSGAADQTAAALVSTGLELAIPLSAIGNPTSGIKISAMVNSADPHTYLSNQFLGGLPAPQNNLGGDGTGAFTGTVGAINLNNYSGNQYFTIAVPEPSSVALAGWALVGMAGGLWRRKRSF
jgi:hypothetical protein